MSGAPAALTLTRDVGKLTAFLRRDLLAAWSYRTAFLTEIAGLALQALLFGLVGRMIDQDVIPSYGGRAPDYLAFVATGLIVGGLVQIGMHKLVSVTRSEQLMGTLEALYATPTRLGTLQFGSVLYDLVTVPIRTGLFLLFVVGLLDVRLEWAGFVPTVVVLAALLPAVWGVGLVGAASVLTFRHGGGAAGLVAGGLAFASGVYIPLELLPGWVQALATVNPVAVALDAVRSLLLGGAGWEAVTAALGPLAVTSGIGVMGGSAAFALAVRRERRRGTLGQY